jgi:hypothetical protein
MFLKFLTYNSRISINMTYSTIFLPVKFRRRFLLKSTIVVQFSSSPLTFRRKVWPPAAGSKSKPSEISKKQSLISCLAYTWNLKMDAMNSSETSVEFYRIAQRCNPEDRTINRHHCENFVYSRSLSESRELKVILGFKVKAIWLPMGLSILT